MKFVIRESSIITARYLKVKDSGVAYLESTLFGRPRKFAFSVIDYVLLSQDGTLSFQVGVEVFSIQANLSRQKHQMAIQRLLESVSVSRQSAGGFPVMPSTAR